MSFPMRKYCLYYDLIHLELCLSNWMKFFLNCNRCTNPIILKPREKKNTHKLLEYIQFDKMLSTEWMWWLLIQHKQYYKQLENEQLEWTRGIIQIQKIQRNKENKRWKWSKTCDFHSAMRFASFTTFIRLNALHHIKYSSQVSKLTKINYIIIIMNNKHLKMEQKKTMINYLYLVN